MHASNDVPRSRVLRRRRRRTRRRRNTAPARRARFHPSVAPSRTYERTNDERVRHARIRFASSRHRIEPRRRGHDVSSGAHGVDARAREREKKVRRVREVGRAFGASRGSMTRRHSFIHSFIHSFVRARRRGCLSGTVRIWGYESACMVHLSVPCTIVRTHTLSYSKDSTYITSAGCIYVTWYARVVAFSGSTRAHGRRSVIVATLRRHGLIPRWSRNRTLASSRAPRRTRASTRVATCDVQRPQRRQR